jgi:hypothetical protein
VSFWNPLLTIVVSDQKTVLKDFGFVLSQNEAVELVLASPIDLTKPLHPEHCVFSSPATVDDPYWTLDERYLSLVTVRSPLYDRRGPINPDHPVPWLRHFDPTFISMVSFEVANLAERATLRLKPYEIPSKRNEKATIQFISTCLTGMLEKIEQNTKALGEPQNERQRRAGAYTLEQKTILKEVLNILK